MATIAHQVWIDAGKGKVYDAATLTEGLSGWWIKDCTAKPEIGFVNEFKLNSQVHDKMKVLALRQEEYVEWECVNDNGIWTGTHISFAIKEKNGLSVLDFKHSLWEQETEFFTICNFHWARHLLMLKAYCETGVGQVDPQVEACWMNIARRLIYNE